jgi:hypothetical protein
MSYYGDLVPLWSAFLVDEIIATDMPTAIVRYYCSDGFLIVTDGLALNSEDGEPISTEYKKVFPLPKLKAAFSITGIGTLGLPGKDSNPQFSFPEVILKVAKSISTWSCRSMVEYARKLGKKVWKELPISGFIIKVERSRSH